jgi:hypothetical protein
MDTVPTEDIPATPSMGGEEGSRVNTVTPVSTEQQQNLIVEGGSSNSSTEDSQ